MPVVDQSPLGLMLHTRQARKGLEPGSTFRFGSSVPNVSVTNSGTRWDGTGDRGRSKLSSHRRGRVRGSSTGRLGRCFLVLRPLELELPVQEGSGW